MKTSVSKEKVACPCNQRLCDMQFSNFAIKYLHKNEKVRETVFASSYGSHNESFKQKKVNNLVTLSLYVFYSKHSTVCSVVIYTQSFSLKEFT